MQSSLIEYFPKGGKQDGKLCSITRFDTAKISTMLDDSSVDIITNFKTNPDSN